MGQLRCSSSSSLVSPPTPLGVFASPISALGNISHESSYTAIGYHRTDQLPQFDREQGGQRVPEEKDRLFQLIPFLYEAALNRSLPSPLLSADSVCCAENYS